MFWLNISDIETICFNFCEIFFSDFKQPIPPFTTRYVGKLESCLATPLIQFSGVDMYKTFKDKLAILFYLMNKDHPFVNGNKRMAVATLLVTLFGNKKWLNVSPVVLYNFAVYVAKSDRKKKDVVTTQIKKFLTSNLVNL